MKTIRNWLTSLFFGACFFGAFGALAFVAELSCRALGCGL